MKNQIKSFLLSALLATGSAFADGMTAVHPGYTMTDIQPAGRSFLVGGLSFYSNGDMAVCNWGNPGEVWVVKDPRSGDKAAIQAKKFAIGMQQVLGCTIVRDTLYVMQMGELTAVIDKDGDGVADEYNKVNDNFATSESLLGYSYDVQYLQGSFYAVLSSDVMRGGMDANPSLANRSVFIRMGRDNTTDILSSGFRNPNGMGLGFGNRLFSVDNQGSWLPSSKIIYLQKGKFYGHHNHTPAPFEDQPETWPMVWLPKGIIDHQPGNVAFIKEGIFKGQFFFAEPDKRFPGRIYRVYAEDVNGVMQGGVVPFSGGLSGVMRVAIGPDNVVYAGNLNSNGGWDKLSSMDPGLKRLVPKNVNQVATFEILRVRSTSSTTLEIDYTKPVAAGGSYTAEEWTFKPGEPYGSGNTQDSHALTVSAVTAKGASTVELKISGMTPKYLIHIKLNGVKASDGEAPWGSETWFTLNAHGPGKVPEIADCMDANQYTGVNYPPDCGAPLVAADTHGILGSGMQTVGAGRLSLSLPQGQAYTLHAFDMLGVERKVWRGIGPADIDAAQSHLAPGLYFMQLRAGAYSATLKMIQP
jgi:hypothetical protein